MTIGPHAVMADVVVGLAVAAVAGLDKAEARDSGTVVDNITELLIPSELRAPDEKIMRIRRRPEP